MGLDDIVKKAVLVGALGLASLMPLKADEINSVQQLDQFIQNYYYDSENIRGPPVEATGDILKIAKDYDMNTEQMDQFIQNYYYDSENIRGPPVEATGDILRIAKDYDMNAEQMDQFIENYYYDSENIRGPPVEATGDILRIAKDYDMNTEQMDQFIENYYYDSENIRGPPVEATGDILRIVKDYDMNTEQMDQFIQNYYYDSENIRGPPVEATGDILRIAKDYDMNTEQIDQFIENYYYDSENIRGPPVEATGDILELININQEVYDSLIPLPVEKPEYNFITDNLVFDYFHVENYPEFNDDFLNAYSGAVDILFDRAQENPSEASELYNQIISSYENIIENVGEERFLESLDADSEDHENLTESILRSYIRNEIKRSENNYANSLWNIWNINYNDSK